MSLSLARHGSHSGGDSCFCMRDSLSLDFDSLPEFVHSSKSSGNYRQGLFQNHGDAVAKSPDSDCARALGLHHWGLFFDRRHVFALFRLQQDYFLKFSEKKFQSRI